MASEILTVPEEHLLEVIAVIRAGLKASGKAKPKITPEVRRQLTKWCDDEEKYMANLDEIPFG